MKNNNNKKHQTYLGMSPTYANWMLEAFKVELPLGISVGGGE